MAAAKESDASRLSEGLSLVPPTPQGGGQCTRRELLRNGLTVLATAALTGGIFEGWKLASDAFAGDPKYDKAYAANGSLVEDAYKYFGEDYQGLIPFIPGWKDYKNGVRNEAQKGYENKSDRWQVFRQLYGKAVKEADGHKVIQLTQDQNRLFHITEAYAATRALNLQESTRDPRARLLQGVDKFIDALANATRAKTYVLGTKEAEELQQREAAQLISLLPPERQAQIDSRNWLSILNTAFAYIAS